MFQEREGLCGVMAERGQAACHGVWGHGNVWGCVRAVCMSVCLCVCLQSRVAALQRRRVGEGGVISTENKRHSQTASQTARQQEGAAPLHPGGKGASCPAAAAGDEPVGAHRMHRSPPGSGCPIPSQVRPTRRCPGPRTAGRAAGPIDALLTTEAT